MLSILSGLAFTSDREPDNVEVGQRSGWNYIRGESVI